MTIAGNLPHKATFNPHTSAASPEEEKAVEVGRAQEKQAGSARQAMGKTKAKVEDQPSRTKSGTLNNSIDLNSLRAGSADVKRQAALRNARNIQQILQEGADDAGKCHEKWRLAVSSPRGQRVGSRQVDEKIGRDTRKTTSALRQRRRSYISKRLVDELDTDTKGLFAEQASVHEPLNLADCRAPKVGICVKSNADGLAQTSDSLGPTRQLEAFAQSHGPIDHEQSLASVELACDDRHEGDSYTQSCPMSPRKWCIEVPRLRSRFRDQSKILGGETSLQASTLKRHNQKAACALGLVEGDDWNPDHVYRISMNDLEKAAEQKAERERHQAAARVQRSWASAKLQRVSISCVAKRKSAIQRIQKWWRHNRAFRRPLAQRCRERPRRIRATIKIQAWLRGWLTRGKVRSTLELRTIMSRLAALQQTLGNEHEVAMLFIQAAVRRFCATRHVQEAQQSVEEFFQKAKLAEAATTAHGHGKRRMSFSGVALARSVGYNLSVAPASTKNRRSSDSGNSSPRTSTVANWEGSIRQRTDHSEVAAPHTRVVTFGPPKCESPASTPRAQMDAFAAIGTPTGFAHNLRKKCASAHLHGISTSWFVLRTPLRATGGLTGERVGSPPQQQSTSNGKSTKLASLELPAGMKVVKIVDGLNL